MSQSTSWIWHQGLKDLGEQYVRFRRKFRLDAKPTSAIIQISADSRYRLFVNGTYIAFGPTRSYPHRQCVDVHKAAHLLQSGDNLIAVHVYQPGYSHYSYVHRGNSGLWLALDLDDQRQLVSDSTWSASVDPSFLSDVRRISIYGAGQEIRDLRQSEPWKELGFDDQSWEAASVLVNRGEIPWQTMQVAPIKNLVESITHPSRVACSHGPYVSDADPHEEMRSAFPCGSIDVAKLAKPQDAELPLVEQGDVLLLCYDLGHSQAGSARLFFRGAQGGEAVLVSYLDKEVDGRLVLSDPSTYCQMRMTDRIMLAPGENLFEPFTPRGGRFLLLGIVGPSRGKLSLEVEFRSRYYPLALERNAMPKNRALQPIAEMCWRTLQSCALDGMVDCPWREQAVWVGDSAITAGIVAEMCGDPRLLKRMLQLASDGSTADGLIPGVVVNESDSTVVLAYSFAWVEGLSQYLALTGDVDFVHQVWNVLATMLRRFQDDLDSEGLLRSQPSRRQFLDWAELPESEPSCLYNLRYLYVLQLASVLASQIDRSDDAQTWREWATSLAAAIHHTFCQCGKWFDDMQGTSRSQHAAAFLTLTELVNEEESLRLLREAVARSLDERDNALVLMSPYMHYYLFLALERLNQENDILDIIKYRWSTWLAQGARTTWENWEIDFPDGSSCHAWSAHPLLFIARHADCKSSFKQDEESINTHQKIGKLKPS